MRRPRLVYIVTHAVTAELLLEGQLAFMRRAGFDVTLIGSPGSGLDRAGRREGVRVVGMQMERSITPGQDAKALMQLTTVLRRLRPDIVNASTPKAGLLGMVAAWMAGVPARIYLLRGLRLEGERGVVRASLVAAERVASACAHQVVCVSPSLMRAATTPGYVSAAKATVLASGSSNGVDVERFAATPARRQEARARLRMFGMGLDAPVIGFIGRMVADKGVEPLLDAFEQVRAGHPKAKLVLVGGDLADEDVEAGLRRRIRAGAGVIDVGRVSDVALLLPAFDALAFPSFREGLPNAVLEAAAAQVPTVGFRSTGVVDAVVDGQTGMLVDRGDVQGLARALARYIKDPTLRRAHGAAAHERVERLFARSIVWGAWLRAYRDHLLSRGLPLPTSVLG